MRVRFITAADMDVSAAPIDGALYFDSKIGSPRNTGLTAATPKRHFTSLPGVAVSGAKYYFRGGQQYRPSYTSAEYSSVPAKTVNMSGDVGSRSKLLSWGGDPALIGGDMPVFDWGAVADSAGNSFLSANGQQVTLPAPCSMWHAHFIGGDYLTPSFWSPSCPNDLASVSRFEYYASYAGSLVAHDTPDALIQNWPDTNAAVARDMTLAALTESITYTSTAVSANGQFYTTTVYFKHPRIAEWYGSGVGPIGAAIVFRGNPSNFPYVVYVTGYDEANSTLIGVTNGRATTLGGGGIYQRVHPHDTAGCEWWVLGAPYDLRQPGQYACVVPASGDPKAWRVRGHWQRGQSTVSRWPVLMEITGSHYDIEGVHFGRQAGLGQQSIDLDGSSVIPSVSNTAISLAATDLGLTNVFLTQGLADGAESLARATGGGVLNVTASNIGVSESWSMGGWRSVFQQGTISGITMTETGRTGLYVDSSATTSLLVTDLIYGFAASFHGNGSSFYQGSRNCIVRGSAGVDGVRFITSQAEATIPTVRGLEFSNLLVMGTRSVSTSAGAPILDYMIRSDSGFRGSLVDRAILADGNGFEFYASSNPAYGNDDAIVRRSHFSRLLGQTNGWAPTDGGGPVQFVDVNISSGATNVTTDGATATRVSYVDERPWTGSLNEAQWKDLTKTLADHTLYETVTLGALRWNWSIPAYSDSTPTPGSPVALQLSRLHYFSKMQAGRVVAHVIGARPMSVLSLPVSEGDNGLFILDQGRIVNVSAMPSSGPVTITIEETPQAKVGGVWVSQPLLARRTVFTLQGRQ